MKELTRDQKIALLAIAVAIVGVLATIFYQQHSSGELPDDLKSKNINSNNINISYNTPPIPVSPPKPQSEPFIKITYPRNGDPVPKSIVVNGTISGELPKDHFVWIMVNPTWAVGQWWPQYNTPIQPVNSEWSMPIEVGNDSNGGKKFNIAAVQVDESGNNIINDAVTNGEMRGYPSIKLPTGSEIMYSVTVVRT